MMDDAKPECSNCDCEMDPETLLCPYCDATCGDCLHSLTDCTCDEQQDVDDTVHCCPDCERPNQFGELCVACARERGEQPYQ